MAARALRVAAVIGGVVSRVRADFVLQVTVYSGHSGRSVGSTSVPLRGTRLDPSSAQRVAAGISTAVARARPGPPVGKGAAVVAVARPPRPAARPRPAPRRPTTVAVRAGPRVYVAPRPAPRPPAPRPPRARADDFDDGTDVVDSGTDTPPPDPPAPPPADTTDAGDDDPKPIAKGRPRRIADGGGDLGFEVDDSGGSGRRAKGKDNDEKSSEPTEKVTKKKKDERPFWEKTLELSLGMMLLSRTFDFNDPVEPKSPSNYRSPMVAAILAEVGAYPLAWIGRGPLANLGVVGSYYRVLVLQSQIEGSDPASTTLHQFEVGLRYRWNILGRATSPTIKAGLYFGRLGFAIHWDPAKTPNVSLPDIAYLYLKIAILQLEVPFYQTRRWGVGALASFDYLYVFSAGDIERTDSGGYGKSSTAGIDVAGGVYANYRGFFLKLTGFYRRFFYAFDNQCFKDNTGCKAAGGALDVYKGMTILGGYAF
jgi:hypothetical protein